jgi:opacity protein-like surface antigen
MMNMRLLSVLLLLVALVLSGAMPATAEINAGTSELGVSISSQKLENDNTDTEITTTIINVFYGYFITKAFEIAGNISIVENEINGAGSTQTGLELQGKYHFVGATDIFLPYLGIQAGVYGIDSGSTELRGRSYGFMGGAKYFLSDKVSVNLEYNYRALELEDEDDNTSDSTVTVLGIGYSVYF